MLIFTIFLFIAGIGGAFVHYLPSITLIFLGIYFYALKDNFIHITKDFIIILAIFTAFAVIFDNMFLFFKKIKKVRIIFKIAVSMIMIIMFFIRLI